MWSLPAVLLSVTGFACAGVPVLLLVIARRPAAPRRGLDLPRPSCVHQFASAATGIACPCALSGRWPVVAEAERIVREAWAEDGS